jgi:hypothetical protein
VSTLDPAIKAVTIPTGTRLPGADPASSIAPAANASGQGGSAASPRLPAGAVALAATLSGVTEGTLLEALMLGRDREGGTVLRTPNGTFVANPQPGQAAATALAAVQGNLVKVLLEAVSVGDLLQARLVAVDGRALPTPAPLTLRLTALAARPPEARPAAEGQTQPAAPERTPRAALPLPAEPQPQPPVRTGQTVLAVLQAPPHVAPAEPARPVPPPLPGLLALQTAAAAPAAPATSAPATTPALTQGSLVSIRVLAATPPGAPVPQPGELPPDAILGEVAVEGDADHQRPVLRLPGGTLRLPPTVTAPPGAQVAVEFLASAPTPAIGREPEAERLVKQLENVVLAQVPADPANATRIAERVPAPGRKLTAAALLFLAAARQGDLGGWLDAAAAPTAKPETEEPLRRLGANWRQHTGEEVERNAGENWRSLVLPFHDGVMLRPLVFQLRRRAPKDAAPGDAGETRFLLDIDLTALGALQLDGLIRAKRFDLMLRGAARLDRTMRHELNLLFQESLSALGYAGALAFRDERPTAHVGTAHVEARA